MEIKEILHKFPFKIWARSEFTVFEGENDESCRSASFTFCDASRSFAPRTQKMTSLIRS